MTLHTQPEEIGPVVTLTFEEAEALLRRALGAKGADYVYEQQPVLDNEGLPASACVYFSADDSPSCKIGHVLHYKGVTREDLERGGNNEGTDVANLVAEGILKIDRRTEGLLSLVQEYQDQGMPWGVALDTALEDLDGWVAAKEAEDEDERREWGGPF